MIDLAAPLESDVEVARDLRACIGVRPRDIAALRGERDRSIDRAGVEQPLAEPPRELLGDGGLPCPGGAIDRDDDATHGGRV